MPSDTFSTFQGAHSFSICEATFNNVQGNYIVNQVGLKDERRETLDFHSRLSQNFNHEPYYASRHKQNLGRIAEGTCQWVHENLEFREWRTSISKANPLLWVHGPPGSGKSILCSHVIQGLEQAPTKPALAYHFCDFARQHKEIEILSMIACQLLDIDSLAFSEVPPLPLSIMSVTALQLRKPEYVRTVIKHLVVLSASAIVYFLLDGLDEELIQIPPSRWSEGVGPVLEFLMQMAVELPQHVRVWVSSQKRSEIRTKLAKHYEIDLAPFARRDIISFLSKSVRKIRGPGKEDQDTILDQLEGGAESSFIWATLMVDELKKMPSLSAIKDYIQGGFPSSLNEYYGRIFDRYPQHLRPLASKAFSLIVYAKRPLRFCELWDALWALFSRDNAAFRRDDKPYKECLLEVFQPFIELVPLPGPHSTELPDAMPEHQRICRLIHSTVRDFLLGHRMACQGDATPSGVFSVCPETPLTACLTFLSQPRFGALLRRQDDHWVESNGAPVMESRFLIYASKYWDKHLDSIDNMERQKELLPLVVAFVKSPNFWTVIQVQSIWVEGQFAKLHVHSRGQHLPLHVRRVFPLWFMNSDEGFNIWIQLRSFLRQWRYLLSLGELDETLSAEHWSPSFYVGELHRIWTNALGHNHFLKNRESSMSSFLLSAEGSTQRQKDSLSIFFSDLIDNAGEFMYSLRINIVNLPLAETGESLSLESVIGTATLDCRVETWKLAAGGEPVRQRSQTLSYSASALDLDLYITDSTNPYLRSDRAALAGFASDGRLLRIGSKILLRKETGNFHSISGIHAGGSRKSRYVEEIAVHNSFLITASRTKISAKDIDTSLDHYHQDSESDVDAVDSEEDDDADSDVVVCLDLDEEERYDVENDSDSDMEYASEDDSISEGSSEFSGEDRFQDVLVAPGGDRQYYYSDSSEDVESVNGCGFNRCWRVDSDSSDSDEEEEASRPGQKQHVSGAVTSRADEDGWDVLPRYFGVQPPCHSKPRAMITIWSLDGEPERIFKKEVPIHCKIYCSPPAFHVTKPLAVWPLGDGDILFVDYMARRSFILSMRSSTTLAPSRFISIQCVFSECGKYIHIAALEGCRPDPKVIAKAKEDETPLPPLQTALLLATYRLSTAKTTRSPPKMIHVVRVNLTEVKAMDTKQLPFSYTWTRDHLYVTASWRTLQVWRVHLFHQRGEDNTEAKELDDDEYDEDFQPVMAPEKVVFLPNTCKQRTVRFFPPPTNPPDETNGSAVDSPLLPAKVVVGHDASISQLPISRPTTQHSSNTLQLLGVDAFHRTLLFEDPIVCHLEAKDIGQWVDSRARTKTTKGSGSGQLYKRMDGAEMFNPDDDCDLEPYYF